MRPERILTRARATASALCVLAGIGLLILAGMLDACHDLTDPVDPHQAPCGGQPVYYGEYCCNVNDAEWKCPLEDACGAGPGDCRGLEPSDLARDR